MDPLDQISTPPVGSNTQQGGQALRDRAPNSPPDCTSNICVAYINCVGQSKFTVSKQLQIQSYIKSGNIDMVHLQECKIDDESFANCHFLRSNFNIFSNNTPNDTCYGTASLVRSDIEVKKSAH